MLIILLWSLSLLSFSLLEAHKWSCCEQVLCTLSRASRRLSNLGKATKKWEAQLCLESRSVGLQNYLATTWPLKAPESLNFPLFPKQGNQFHALVPQLVLFPLVKKFLSPIWPANSAFKTQLRLHHPLKLALTFLHSTSLRRNKANVSFLTWSLEHFSCHAMTVTCSEWFLRMPVSLMRLWPFHF